MDSDIGGNAMLNSGGQYASPMMASNISGRNVPLPPVIEAAAIDAQNFGANVSQSSIHQIDQSMTSLAHHNDAITPTSRNVIEGGSAYRPQEVTLLTQHNTSNNQLGPQGNILESRVSDRSIGRAVVVPTTTIQSNQQSFV